MKTELIMTIGLIFKDGEKGKRIVGGAEQNYSTNDLSWLDFNGEKVLIRTGKEDVFLKVKNIDVFPSISGAINIGLTLVDDEKFNTISVGDKVFKISKEMS